MFHLNDNNIRNFRSKFNRLSLLQRAVSFKMQFINLTILLKISRRDTYVCTMFYTQNVKTDKHKAYINCNRLSI
jgi:hypothetical protein